MTYRKLDVPHGHSLKRGQAQRSSVNGILKSVLFVAVAALFFTSSTAFSQEIGSALHGTTRPSSSAEPSVQKTQDILAGQDTGSADAYATTVAYVSHFYPLWFTYYQSKVDSLIGTSNLLVGSDRVTPLYHFVVAINYDTLYSGVYLNLSTEPVVVTFPSNPDNVPFSILVLDPYGNEIKTEIPMQATGAYAFTGPNFSGTLPKGVTGVPMPINYPALYVRVVKLNQVANAEKFRAAFKTQPLSQYLINPTGGATKILPEILFALPFKTVADTMIANQPIAFLKSLQKAVAAPNTPQLDGPEQDLSDRFNALFGNGDTQQFEFTAGAQKAHEMIVSNYLTHTGPTQWIHFRNIGDWGDNVLDRSSITQYIQLANSIETAAYYHTFSDSHGRPLDGSHPRGYVLHFSKDQIPAAKRFWSLTAYTPDAIELVPNSAKKYVVASYTPGLQYGPDGSLTVYMATQLPDDVPPANWLPVPPGKFNIMLRVYGPDGSMVDNTYVPPGVVGR